MMLRLKVKFKQHDMILRCRPFWSFSDPSPLDTKQTFVSRENTHHIDVHGLPIYHERYLEVLSFHSPENLAAAKDSRGWFHIQPTGLPRYERLFSRAFG